MTGDIEVVIDALKESSQVELRVRHLKLFMLLVLIVW